MVFLSRLSLGSIREDARKCGGNWQGTFPGGCYRGKGKAAGSRSLDVLSKGRGSKKEQAAKQAAGDDRRARIKELSEKVKAKPKTKPEPQNLATESGQGLLFPVAQFIDKEPIKKEFSKKAEKLKAELAKERDILKDLATQAGEESQKGLRGEGAMLAPKSIDRIRRMSEKLKEFSARAQSGDVPEARLRTTEIRPKPGAMGSKVQQISKEDFENKLERIGEKRLAAETRRRETERQRFAAEAARRSRARETERRAALKPKKENPLMRDRRAEQQNAPRDAYVFESFYGELDSKVKKMKGRKQEIAVSQGLAEPIKGEAMAYGDWALHRNIGSRRGQKGEGPFEGHGYAVTHIPSGLRIFSADSPGNARKSIYMLHALGVTDEFKTSGEQSPAAARNAAKEALNIPAVADAARLAEAFSRSQARGESSRLPPGYMPGDSLPDFSFAGGAKKKQKRTDSYDELLRRSKRLRNQAA